MKHNKEQQPIADPSASSIANAMLGEGILSGKYVFVNGNVFEFIACCGACQLCIGGRGFFYEQLDIGWVKAANQLGEYRSSYLGFRIYRKTKSKVTEKVIEKEDCIYRIATFSGLDLVAIDKNGNLFRANNIAAICSSIERVYYSFA